MKSVASQHGAHGPGFVLHSAVEAVSAIAAAPLQKPQRKHSDFAGGEEID